MLQVFHDNFALPDLKLHRLKADSHIACRAHAVR
jgi:hypothetical protein